VRIGATGSIVARPRSNFLPLPLREPLCR
jgi:hypothetical protein